MLSPRQWVMKGKEVCAVLIKATAKKNLMVYIESKLWHRSLVAIFH